MIKANELRLGNYLQLKGENFRVSEIQNNLQCVELKRKNLENPRLNDYEECDLDCNDLIPIPITEIILLSCGFKKRKSCFGYWIYEIMFHHTVFSVEEVDLGLCYFYWKHSCYSNKICPRVCKIFIFSITGEELVFSSTEP